MLVKKVVPRVCIRTSFKMKVLFGMIFCVGIIFISAVNVTLGNPPGLRTQGESVEGHADRNSIEDGSDVADLKTLRLVQVLFRHGDRTPIDRFPTDPHDSRECWQEGWGKLTERGKLMQFLLGQYIRHRYDGFVSRTYTADEIYVQSSDVDRTIMSAAANLAGMWPATQTDNQELPEGGKQQFVPVHSISDVVDNKLAFSMPCPKYSKAFAEVLKVPTEAAYNSGHEKLYKELSKHTGLNITSYFNVSDIYDILFVQRAHNLTLPEWASAYFPDELHAIAKHWIKAYTLTDNMRALRAGPLMTEWIRNFKRVIGKPNDEEKKVLEKLFHTPYVKFFMYSGHDTTLSTMLDALGLFDGELPSYASSLYLELHQINDSNEENDYYVKVLHRPGTEKSAKEMKLKNCKSQPCRFNDFMETMNSYIMDEDQWKLQCSL